MASKSNPSEDEKIVVDETTGVAYREIVKKSPAPFYGAGIAWIGYAILFPSTGGMIFSLPPWWLRPFSGSSPKEGEVVREPVAQREEKVSTGNSEADQMIREGEQYLKEIRAANQAIADPKISYQITRMEKSTEKIFDRIREKPEQVSLVRNFMTYYLPTTLKILKAYDKMDDQGISGENIDSTLQEIRRMLQTVADAFEKQLDTLFKRQALDISTDITVLENMLAKGGTHRQRFRSGQEQRRPCDLRDRQAFLIKTIKI